MNDVRKISKAFGFDAVYCLRPEPFLFYEQKRKDGQIPFSPELVSRPKEAFPWCNALVLLIKSYHPYPADAAMASNYPHNNASYHASAGMLRYLNACNIQAERAYVPFRELAQRSGIGVSLRNGMMAIPPYGTRFVTQVMAVSLTQPVFEEKGLSTQLCTDCGACRQDCPAGAIDAEGFHVSKCIRAYMRPGLLPEHVMHLMTKVIGCDACQTHCPYNEGLPFCMNVPDAFSLEHLVQDDSRDALSYIGTNMKSGNRLCQHALIVAGNRGRVDLLPEIERMANDVREPIRQAAVYAISMLRKT